MTPGIASARDFAGQLVRLGWYTGLGALAARRARQLGYTRPPPKEGRLVPNERAVMADLLGLFESDAALVRDEAAAPVDEPPAHLADHLERVSEMFREIPEALRRQGERAFGTAREEAAAAGLPDYFVQDFHFQDGGYLTDKSARLYDIQVETLFRGSALAMRRQALRPIADYMRGRDQRTVSLLDVACGTGRLLREIRRVYPAMQLLGLDLSGPYLREASRHLTGLRPASLIEGNAEVMPFEAGSVDIVTCVYLFHELPSEVRRRVIGEVARVLKPGGLFVMIDSLQKGDRPGGWDGFLEGFPERFHEPFYRHYLVDDLDGALAKAGLGAVSTWPAFLSKVMVRKKA